MKKKMVMMMMMMMMMMIEMVMMSSAMRILLKSWLTRGTPFFRERGKQPIFSNTLTLRSSLKVGDQVSHP